MIIESHLDRKAKVVICHDHEKEAKVSPLSHPVLIQVRPGTNFVCISTCEEGKDYLHQLKGGPYYWYDKPSF